MPTKTTKQDHEYIQRALRLAKRGLGRAEPNPMVGCVIVRRNKIVGEGYHKQYGGPHAEVNALRSCKESPRGATAYVTLEPCSHFGKTPPCANALIEAGIKRVVIGCKDPFEKVSGGGIQILRKAGVAVEVGTLQSECEEIIRPFATLVTKGRPYVIAKWAQSIDGKIATHTGDSKWISGEESRQWVHKLRARLDAVMVGSNTVLKDDPLLTARGVTLKRTAARVVWDRRLRTPSKSKLVKSVSDAPLYIITSKQKAESKKAESLRRVGVQIITCPVLSKGTNKERLNVAAGLKKLGKLNMTNVLLEGGAGLLASFFAANRIDEVHAFVAPMIIGGDAAPTAVGGAGFRLVQNAWQAQTAKTTKSGRDLHIEFRP